MGKTGNEAASKQQAGVPCERLPLIQTGQAFNFFNGIRVVDLTTSVAGPYATMLLSDFGAEIIKIERPSGDDARHWGPPFYDKQALWFTAVNRNKKSVVLDLHVQGERNDLLALIRTADVLVTNQTLDVQEKLGLSYERLRQEKKDLIFVSISGFGLTGERAALTCYDLIAEGYSGIMDITGEADGGPQKIGAPAADMLAGQDAAMAVMAALFDRSKTGAGRQIEISLVESMTRFLACRISSYLGSGEVPERSGGKDSVIAIYQPFETADLPINLGIGSDAIWKRFWETVGDTAYGQRPEFASNMLRRENRPAIVSHIQNILRAKTRAEWLEQFAAARVPAGPINSVDQVAHDEALQKRGMFFALQDATGRTVPQIGLGIQVDGQYCVPRSLPPRLGEHTKELKSLLGL